MAGCSIVARQILTAHDAQNVLPPAGQRFLPTGGQSRQQWDGQAGWQLAQAQPVPAVPRQQFCQSVGPSPKGEVTYGDRCQVAVGPARLGDWAQVGLESEVTVGDGRRGEDGIASCQHLEKNK